MDLLVVNLLLVHLAALQLGQKHYEILVRAKVFP